MARAVLAYLGGTKDMGICFEGEKGLKLEGYCDANYAGDLDTRRSTTGYLFTLAGGAISWASKCQPTVACSTVEAEYMAAALTTRDAMWIKKLFSDVSIPCQPIIIHCDNQGAIQLSKHAIASPRTKHIDISHHFVRERVIRREVELRYVNKERQAADFLTKAVSVDNFELCRDLAGLT
jgi:hypothetical protein